MPSAKCALARALFGANLGINTRCAHTLCSTLGEFSVKRTQDMNTMGKTGVKFASQPWVLDDELPNALQDSKHCGGTSAVLSSRY